MLETYAGAALLLAACVLVGQAVLVLAGTVRWSWWAPAVGLATLVVLASIAIGLPGRGTTAAVIVGLLTALALALVVRRCTWRLPWQAAAVALPATLGASLPFLASDRVGIPGVSLDNDTAVHLLWAEGLRSAAAASAYPRLYGYPIGPHSLFATLASATGIRLDHALIALLLTVVPVTALAAAGAMPRASWWRKAILGVIAALAYLTAAYYAEGAFKETMMGLFLLVLVLMLRELRASAAERRAPLAWARAAIPAGLVVAAGLYTYSYLAVAWLGGFLGVWLLAELIASPSLAFNASVRRAWVPPAAVAVAGGLVVCAVAAAPAAGQLHSYMSAVGASGGGAGIPASNLGNLAGPLSVFEAFGVWVQADFRFVPAATFHAGELGGLALAVLVFGLLWALRRRDLALPSGIAICAAIYLYSHAHQSPYVTAKALVIAAPLVIVTGGRALLSGREDSLSDGPASLVRLLAGIGFAVAALHSSTLALRGEPVGSTVQISELQALRTIVGRAPTVFLGNDDYAGWDLRGVPLAYPSTTAFGSPLRIALSSKPYAYGTPFDFDSVQGSQLDSFNYVITTNTPYASQAPENFRLVKRLALYELWRRVAPTSPRSNIDPAEAPGAVLDCHTHAGARLSRLHGVAAVMTTPVLSGNIGTISPNGNATAMLKLPRGTWDLSLEYTSAEVLKFTVGSTHRTLPANTARPGPYYYFDTVSSDGRHTTRVQIYEEHPSRFTSPIDVANLSDVAATASPDARTIVPLAGACGRYVDWYRVGPGVPGA